MRTYIGVDEFILLADFWIAEGAYRIGLVNRVLPMDKLESETMAMARRLASGPPISLRLSKLQVYNGLRMYLDVALTFRGASEHITLMTDDHMEGVFQSGDGYGRILISRKLSKW